MADLAQSSTFHGLPLLVGNNLSYRYLESMEFTAGLGAKDARLTLIPGDNGENREQGGKKYKRSGNHGENDAFTRCLKEGRQAHFYLPDSSLSVIYAQSPIARLTF